MSIKRPRSEKSENEALGDDEDTDIDAGKNELCFSRTIDELIKKVNLLATTNAKLSKTVHNLKVLVEEQNKKFKNTETKLCFKIAELENKVITMGSQLDELKNGKSDSAVPHAQTAAQNDSTWSSIVKSRIRRGPASDQIQADKLLADSTIDQTNFVLGENSDRENRKSNVLVFGLEADANLDTLKQVEKVFDSIGAKRTVIHQVRRFRQTDSGKIPPVLVQLKSREEGIKVLNLAKRLKSSSLGKINIKQDLTLCQRRLVKQLQEERDKLNKDEEAKEVGRRRWWFIKDNTLRSTPFKTKTTSN